MPVPRAVPACRRIGARLAMGTQARQQRIDDELTALAPRTFLCRMYGLHLPVEAALASTRDLCAVVADAKLRNNKGALLAHDLVSLGVDRHELAQIPRIDLPARPFAELPVALGWMYVLETTALTVRRARGAATPCAYLACYGRGVEKRWRELVDALDDYAARDPDAGDRIVDGATESLDRVHRWLTQ